MNTKYLFQQIKPYIKDNKLTYEDFDKVFGFLPLKEQYPIAYAIQDDLNIEFVDEIDVALIEEEISAEVAQFIIKSPYEIKVPNKFLIRLIQDGDEQAKQDLCIKNSGLVGKFATKYQKMYPNTLELEDLMQEGNIGLIIAAERFDFNKDTAFSTYASWWIKQRIMRAIAEMGLAIRLPVHIVENILKASKLDREFQMQNIELRKRLELIAAEMNVTSEKIRELFKWRDVYFRIVSLDIPIGEDSDTPLLNFIPGEENLLDEKISVVLLREQLDEILKTLTPRERDVLTLRFGLEDGKSRTLEEVGNIFNVTRERIRQIEVKALRKLRHPARSNKLRDFLN